MATKLFLTNLAANYTPATIRGAWDDSAGAVTKALDVYKDGGGAITTVARANTNASATYDVLLYRGVSGPLAAQTFAGTLDVILGVIESNALGNFYWHVHVYVTQGDSDTPRGDLLTDYVENTTNEWGTTAATNGKALVLAQAVVGLAISDGDRIVVEIGYIDREGSATSRTGTLNYGTLDPTLLTPAADLTVGGAGASLAGFLNFSATLTELSASVKARLTQTMTKVLRDAEPKARLTQGMLKVLRDAEPKARLTQTMIKVLRSTAEVAPSAGGVFFTMGHSGSGDGAFFTMGRGF
jgi:hypothetical protein